MRHHGATVCLSRASADSYHEEEPVAGVGEECPSDTPLRRECYAIEPTTRTLDGCAARPHGRARRVHL
jgi:hypothetical protein